MEDKENDINDYTIKKYINTIRSNNPEIIKQIDQGYSFDGSIVELFEIRPRWDNSNEVDKYSYGKIRYYKSRSEWVLYWKRASGKWETYDPSPVFTHLGKALEVIQEDSHGCFRG